MSIQGTDIVFVLSGGANNTNASLALGGEPSQYPLSSGALNSVFSDITISESQTGLIDYRCIYVFNNNDTYSLYGTQVYIASTTSGGSVITIGIPVSTDVQRIVVTGSPTGVSPSFTVIFDNLPFIVAYSSNISTWAANLQNGFNTLLDTHGNQVLSGVKVVPAIVPATAHTPQIVTFTISFLKADDNTNQPLATVHNNLGPGVTISSTKIQQGAPINSIAYSIASDTITPAGITFSSPVQSSPISLGILKAKEGFPVWIQRTTLPTSNAMQNDKLVLTVSGSPISI